MAAKKRAKKSAKSTKRPAKRAAKRPAKKAGKRKANPALKRKVKPSATLAAVVGAAPDSRGQMMRKLWVYIKRNKLQVPGRMQFIKPDAKLARVLGGPATIKMTAMTAKVSKHLSAT